MSNGFYVNDDGILVITEPSLLEAAVSASPLNALFIKALQSQGKLISKESAL